jgi:hypothetical protein
VGSATGVTDPRLSLAVTIRVRGFGLSGATTDPSSTSLEGLEGGVRLCKVVRSGDRGAAGGEQGQGCHAQEGR